MRWEITCCRPARGSEWNRKEKGKEKEEDEEEKGEKEKETRAISRGEK